MSGLADQVTTLADELESLIEWCDQPAYGAPGHAHCAACCYNTGITSMEDQHLWDAVNALRQVARDSAGVSR